MADVISNKTIDYTAYVRENGNATKIPDTTTVTLPSIEKLTDKIKGSGIIGEIDVPTYGQIGSMETEIETRTANEKMGLLLTASEIEYRWVTDSLDPSTGRISPIAHKAFLKVINKKGEEGKLEPGAAQDGKYSYEVLAYRRIINGKEILNIDKLNGVYIVNGKDMFSDINQYL
ncbi:phage major tail tube protein [Clostridium sp. C2-6-12]|uniref:phage major tail tube protein n=1 Tax=Clostridium sp. C2-6-12 TaxID=2698832 RepID=UPI00136BDBEC|nr:phage major tail tube protein [Clostridium sp. C2-6-12]